MLYFSHYSCYIRDGHGTGSGVRLHFSDPEQDPDLKFLEKAGFGFGINGMVYIECI